MTLAFPSPAAFAQSVRMVLQATEPSVPVLLVEGKSDKQTLGRIVGSEAKVLAARGKEMVLGARQHLSPAELQRCTLLVDCDGEVDSTWLGDGAVIVSTNRDLDVDLVIELGALRSVAFEYLIPLYESTVAVETHAVALENFTLSLAASFGIALDASRNLGYAIKVYDSHLGRKRRVQVLDLGESADWLKSSMPPNIEVIVDALGSALSWPDAARSAVLEAAREGGRKLCRRHGGEDCVDCKVRRFANGHDVVDISSLTLSELSGFSVSPAEIARSMRISVPISSAPLGWPTYDRLASRSRRTGMAILRQRRH